MTNIDINIQIASEFDPLPSKAQLEQWAMAALQDFQNHTELTVRVVDIPEIQTLNKNYREKDKPTNVLSFPMEMPADIDVNLLGDVVICAPVVWQEAEQQGKAYQAHFAHMVVHGCLHLLGYDHTTPEEAEKMEPLEISLLKTLNFSNPYEGKR
jgi:probable rRNA maturation factor